MGWVEMTGIPDINNGTGSSIKMAKKCLAHSRNKKPVWLGLRTVAVWDKM